MPYQVPINTELEGNLAGDSSASHMGFLLAQNGEVERPFQSILSIPCVQEVFTHIIQ